MFVVVHGAILAARNNENHLVGAAVPWPPELPSPEKPFLRSTHSPLPEYIDGIAKVRGWNHLSLRMTWTPPATVLGRQTH
jgi:hypothetical protein